MKPLVQFVRTFINTITNKGGFEEDPKFDETPNTISPP